jgi:hypothetical protein
MLPIEGRLGHWHADRLVLDRRQCVLFCHDHSRAALFAAGLRKPQFAALGDLFRPLFAETLVALGCPVNGNIKLTPLGGQYYSAGDSPDSQARRALMALGPARFDTATNRSVLSSMRVIRNDLEAWLNRFPDVMAVDPVETSCRLTRRPASIRGGKLIWPNDLLLELVAGLSTVGRDAASPTTAS